MPFKYHEALLPFLVDAYSIRPDPANYNNGDIDDITESLLINGCYRPIYVSRETGMITGGTNLYHALLGLNQSSVPVLWTDGDKEVSHRILVGDNLIARKAWVDKPLLVDVLEELLETERGLYGTGVTEAELDILRDVSAPKDEFVIPDPEPDDIPGEFKCPSCGYEWSGRPHDH